MGASHFIGWFLSLRLYNYESFMVMNEKEKYDQIVFIQSSRKRTQFLLPKYRPLVPLYEAIVNSINAIDERRKK